MAYTADQLALLRAYHREAKVAVEIGTTTPRRYCSGRDPVQISGSWFTPRGLKGQALKLADATTMRTTITLDDADGVLRAANYTERFSGTTVKVYTLLRLPPRRSWTQVTLIEWLAGKCRASSPAQIALELVAAAGLKPRASGELGSRQLFEYAPAPGEQIAVGANYVSYGGQARPEQQVRRWNDELGMFEITWE